MTGSGGGSFTLLLYLRKYCVRSAVSLTAIDYVPSFPCPVVRNDELYTVAHAG